MSALPGQLELDFAAAEEWPSVDAPTLFAGVIIPPAGWRTGEVRTVGDAKLEGSRELRCCEGCDRARRTAFLMVSVRWKWAGPRGKSPTSYLAGRCYGAHLCRECLTPEGVARAAAKGTPSAAPSDEG